ncbi:M16 family metallopeptidase [Stutzerimonas tarimensis]|uniref:M16 family metallopeptidase n=1 Tax=Stutzerimonas tarimensis TaxID=1507735 RepID=A0ABV7TA53_9GAMM
MNKRPALFLLAAALLALAGCQSPSPVATDPGLSELAARLESLAGLGDQTLARRDLEIHSWKTVEGAQVLFVEARELPMFDLRLTFAAGSSQDGGVPGLASLTNAMLDEGVPGRDATAIAQGFEELGASFGKGAYRDMGVLSLRSLSDPARREPALALFSQVAGQPSFPADSLARIKNQLMAGFEMQKQNPGRLASLALFESLYDEHPYGHPSEGTPASVPAIAVEQLRAFHRRAYSAGNAVIALIGDLDREEAQAIASQVSAALPQDSPPGPLAQPRRPEGSRQHIEFPSQQTHLMLAQLGVPRGHPDYPALYLGNQILGGGGFGTRLMEEVREKRGLTYGIYSGFTPMRAAGPFMISVQTRADMAEGTLELVQALVREFLAEGPTEAELERAKRETAGSFPLSTASNADIVGQLGSIGFYGLPLGYLEDFMRDVQAVSAEDIRAAMNRHLSAEDFTVVSVGPSVTQLPLPPPSNEPRELPSGVPEH